MEQLIFWIRSVKEFSDYAKLFTTIALLGIGFVAARLYGSLVGRPKRLRTFMAQQGIIGPPPALVLGNAVEIKKARAHISPSNVSAGESPVEHRCSEILFPFFEKWRSQYGEVFMFSLGTMQVLYVNRANVVREITTCTSLELGKPSYQSREHRPLLGRGILTSNGTVWAHQRKILAPHLYMDKVKRMIGLVNESANTLVDLWSRKVDFGGGTADIKIDSGLKSFSGDVISRACFGSNFVKGQHIFDKLRSLQEAMSKKQFLTGIPGLRYLPIKSNRESWTLEAEVAKLILQVVKERESGAHEKDLLQDILEGSRGIKLGREATENFIVDNCKNIYLAGYETTAVAATWCLSLLAANPKWQDSARAEVLEIFRDNRPIDYDSLLKMKQVTMVIHETLRLYPPATVVSRETFKDMKFGDIDVPKGMIVWAMMVTLHTDPDIWGPDSYEFKPERFANGISKACKSPSIYMPFGVGPRVCLGQNLAMVELKILLSLILSNFSFSLSPNYRYSPALKLVVQPEFGVDLLMTRLK